MKLQDSIVLITGAAKRVGRGVALHLARQGAHIILHYHRSFREAKSLEKEIKDLGRECKLLKGDLSKLSDVKKLAREAFAWKKKIDVLINNASVFYPTPLGTLQEKQWDEFFNLHAKAAYFLSEFLGGKMAQKGRGRIINICDVSALKPTPNYVPYSASKAALIAITQGLARTLAPHVTVNAILPGPVMLPEDYGTKIKNKIIRKIPLKRIGSPEDIAKGIQFLIESDYITGALIPIDGGLLLG